MSNTVHSGCARLEGTEEICLSHQKSLLQSTVPVITSCKNFVSVISINGVVAYQREHLSIPPLGAVCNTMESRVVLGYNGDKPDFSHVSEQVPVAKPFKARGMGEGRRGSTGARAASGWGLLGKEGICVRGGRAHTGTFLGSRRTHPRHA